MKKIIYGLLVFFLTVQSMTSAAMAEASQTTTYTYTVVDEPRGEGKSHLARTQDAYIPERTITDLGLSSPADIFIDENNIIYIADAGNKRIVKYDIATDECLGQLTCKEFKSPKGVCVTRNGDIYVADSMASTIFVFNKEQELIQKIGRPQAPAFENTPFDPHKIAVDENGNIYVVGEGVYGGIIQLSFDGDFLGFFAVNEAKLTFLQRIQSIIFTREQMEKMSDINPTTFTNVGIDYCGIVYTVTGGESINAIKKHKTNGTNMFTSTVYSDVDMTDVWVDENLFVYASSKSGYIDVFTPQGDLIFEFGSSETRLDVAGLFNSLVTLAVDQNGYIWAADGAKGYLQSYRPTEYTEQVYRALLLYEGGYYNEALKVWEEVLALNQMSVIAHNGIGNAYMSQYDFENAMEHYEIAGNHSKYSDAFWELRNVWLQRYLAYFLIAVVITVLAVYAVKKFDKKRKVANLLASAKARVTDIKGIRELFYSFRVARHPLDSYYDIRVNKAGTVVGATILYGLLFASFMLYMVGKGFIYQYQDVQDMDISSLVIGFFAILGLFVICNYLVTSINDGQGSLKQVYLLLAYAMTPLIVALLSVTALSYVVTNNEAFFLTVALTIGVTWTLILIFLGLETVHDYSVKETIASILITFLFMLIVVIVVMVVTIMWDQVWSFLSTVGEELKQYVLQ